MKIVKLFVLFVAISFVIGVGSAFNGQNNSSTEFVDKNDVERNSTQVEQVETPFAKEESTEVVDKEESEKNKPVNNNSFSQSKNENSQTTKETNTKTEIVKEQQSVDKPKVEENESVKQESEDKVEENNSQNETVEETLPPSVEEEKKELTIWKELGISEYEYYNTPMFKWQTVTHTDFDSCDLAGKEATKIKKNEITGEEYQDYSQYWCYGVNSYSGKFLGTMLKLTK